MSISLMLGAFVASAWDQNNPESVKEYVSYVAAHEGVSVALVMKIAACESGFRKNAIGDHGNSYGVFQIHWPSHPDLTQAELLNPFANINWAVNQMALGNWHMWTCFRMV